MQLGQRRRDWRQPTCSIVSGTTEGNGQKTDTIFVASAEIGDWPKFCDRQCHFLSESLIY